MMERDLLGVSFLIGETSRLQGVMLIAFVSWEPAVRRLCY